MKKQIAIFSIANLLGALISMLASLWVANLAGPNLMGTYNFLQLLVTYAPLLGLGVFNGLNRELPFSIGQDKYEEAELLDPTVEVRLFLGAGKTVGDGPELRRRPRLLDDRGPESRHDARPHEDGVLVCLRRFARGHGGSLRPFLHGK